MQSADTINRLSNDRPRFCRLELVEGRVNKLGSVELLDWGISNLKLADSQSADLETGSWQTRRPGVCKLRDPWVTRDPQVGRLQVSGLGSQQTRRLADLELAD